MHPPPEASRPFPTRRLLLWLILPALGLRLLQIGWTADDPLVRFPFEDGLSYSKWALEIAEGDWLGRSRPVYYQAPFFPYLLGGMHALGLGFWPWPQLLNALAGTATVLFVFLATDRLLGRRPAWIAGGALAVWGPALMYELLLDKVALGLCLAAAGCYVLVRLQAHARDRPDDCGRACLLAGGLLGLGAMLRENLLVLVPVAMVVVWIQAHRVRPLGLLATGVVLGLLPVSLHNGLVGGEWLPTTYQGGTNFWIGNHAGAEGTYEPLRPGRGDPTYEEADAVALAAAALEKSPDTIARGEVNRYWFGQGLSFAARDPGAWLGLQLRKLQWFIFHAEAPDSIPYAAFAAGRPWFLPTRLLFGLLLPLTLLGAWLLRRRQDARIMLALGATACASVVLFFVVSRYRLACLPFLLPFAAHAALATCARPVLLLPLALLAVPAQIWLPSRPPAGLDSSAQEACLWVNRGTVLGIWTKDRAGAIAAFEKALAIEPELLAAHRSLARLLMHPDHADHERALPHCAAHVRLAPDDLEARHNLGFCLLGLGELEKAEREFRRVLEAAGPDAPLLTVRQLARCLRRRGKPTDADRLLRDYGAQPSR